MSFIKRNTFVKKVLTAVTIVALLCATLVPTAVLANSSGGGGRQ